MAARSTTTTTTTSAAFIISTHNGPRQRQENSCLSSRVGRFPITDYSVIPSSPPTRHCFGSGRIRDGNNNGVVVALNAVGGAGGGKSAATATAATAATATAAAKASAEQLYPYRGAGLVVRDHSSDAIKFFTAIRIPAALIVGSSLALVFTLAKRARDSELKHNSPLENAVLLVYQTMSLVSFLLSLNVVLTSSVASTALLLGVEDCMARSTHELLTRELHFEFLLTRWSFYVAMYNFLGAITLRFLMEFELLSKKRIRSALMLLLSIASLGFHWTSHVNASLHCWPNLFAMTLGIGKSCFQRAFSRTHGSFCQKCSCLCFVGALLVLSQMVMRIVQFSEVPSLLQVPNNATATTDENATISNVSV